MELTRICQIEELNKNTCFESRNPGVVIAWTESEIVKLAILTIIYASIFYIKFGGLKQHIDHCLHKVLIWKKCDFIYRHLQCYTETMPSYKSKAAMANDKNDNSNHQYVCLKLCSVYTLTRSTPQRHHQMI